MDPLIKVMLIWTRVYIGTGPLLMEIPIDIASAFLMTTLIWVLLRACSYLFTKVQVARMNKYDPQP